MALEMVSIGLDIAPLAIDAVRKTLGRTEVGTLFTCLERDVRASSTISPGKHDDVWERVSGLRVDPTFGGCLLAYLERGDIDVEPVMRERLGELLRFDDPEIDDGAVVDLVVGAVEANLHRAKREDREAAHLDQLVTRRKAEAGFEDVKRHVTEEIGTLGGRLGSAPSEAAHVAEDDLSAPTPGIARDARRLLSELRAYDQDGSARLEAAWRARGPRAIAELVRAPQPWLEAASAATWSTAGRLALRLGHDREAADAFLRAADMPDIGDRVRELVRAAVALSNQGDDRADALVDQAHGLDAQHPAVVVFDAKQAGSPETTVDRIRDLRGLDAWQEAEIATVVAGAEIERGDFGAARAALQRGQAADPDGLAVREGWSTVHLHEQRRRLADDEQLDRPVLLEAGATFIDLRDEMLAIGRPSAAAHLAALAVEAYVHADELPRAHSVLDASLDDPAQYAEPTAGGILGEAAIYAQRPSLALRFLPQDGSDSHRLLRADAVVLAEDREHLGDAVAVLRELLAEASDQAIRERAALSLLNAATIDPAIEWDEQAAKLVEERQDWTAAMLGAQRVREAGDLEAAERLLRPHSSRRTVLRALIDLADEQARRDGDWSKALRLSETLLSRGGDDADRVRHGILLSRRDGIDRGVAELLGVARDPNAASPVRHRAYRTAAGLLEEARQFGDVEQVAAEWSRFAPDDEDAGWLRLWALSRRADFAGALAAWRERELEVRTEQQALLVGQLLSVGGAAVEAMETLARHSDHFGRPERLEYALIVTALRREDADVPPDLETRVRETFKTFPERFPSSEHLQAFTIEEDRAAEQFVEVLQRMQGDRPRVTADLARQIAGGETSVTVLAGAAGKSVGETWMRLRALPLGYGDPGLSQLERADAADALSQGGAVWDPSALHIVGGLGDSLTTTLRNSLPASVIAQATLDEAAGDAVSPRRDERDEVAPTEEGQLQWTSWADADVAREHARIDGTLSLARTFPAPRRPPAVEGEDPRLEGMLDDQGHTSLATWIETFLVAQRLELPVFSDDRYLRHAARAIGLKAFGTVALLDALADQAQVSAADRQTARARLLATGAWGVDLAEDELVTAARANEFCLTAALAQATLDRCSWRSSLVDMRSRLLRFLERVHAEAPDQFDTWVARCLDAACQAIPEADELLHARTMLGLALNPLTEPPLVSDRCLHALIRALRDGIPFYLRYRRRRDVLVEAVALLSEFAAGHPRELREAILERALGRLDERDRTLVRRELRLWVPQSGSRDRLFELGGGGGRDVDANHERKGALASSCCPALGLSVCPRRHPPPRPQPQSDQASSGVRFLIAG